MRCYACDAVDSDYDEKTGRFYCHTCWSTIVEVIQDENEEELLGELDEQTGEDT